MVNRKIINKRLSTTIFSKLHLIAFAIVFAGIGGYFIYKSFAASTLYIAPNGNDISNCTQSAPCQSLARAHAVSQPGDTVLIKNGTYPSQTLSGYKSEMVTFKEEPGANAVFSDITLQVGAGNITIDGVSLRDVKIGETALAPGQAPPPNPARDIYLNNIDGRVFSVNYAHRVRILNGDWGPAHHTKPSIATSNPWDPPEAVPVDILVEGNYIHGMTMDPDGEHVEGILVYAGNGIVVRNNIFGKNSAGQISSNGGTGDLGIFFLHLSQSPLIANVIIENNQAFSAPWVKDGDAYYNMQYDEQIPGLVIRNNSFPKGVIGYDFVPSGGIQTAQPPPNWPPSSAGAPTVSLLASPTSIASGASSTLSWDSTNATSCSASGAWSGTKATSGSLSVSPTSTAIYNLSCTGSGGSATASATVTVSTASIALVSSSITAGQTLSGLVAWSAATSGSVAKVEFWANNTKLGEDTTPPSPFTYSLDTTKLPNGTNSLGFGIVGTDGTRITPQVGQVTVSNPAVPPHIAAADLNNDGTVNILDLSILLRHYGTTAAEADINGDGQVNITDLSLLLSRYQ